MSNEREFIHTSLLPSQIVNSEFWFRHTTAIARFDVRLVFTIAVAGS
jgi:hypothetical protein